MRIPKIQKILKKIIQRPGSREGPFAAGRHHAIALGAVHGSVDHPAAQNASIGFIKTGGTTMKAQEYFERHTDDAGLSDQGDEQRSALGSYRGLFPWP